MLASPKFAVPALIVAIGLGLTGCSASGSTPSHGGAVSEIAPAPGARAGSADSSSDVVTRQVVTSGTVVIRAKQPISAADRAASLTDAAGGRVDDRNQTAATRNAPAEATLTLRIPSSKLTKTLAELKNLGTVESISISTVDVTTKSEDLGARITALQTSITRLLALEARATSTADVITLETDIASRQGDLESLTAQQRYLDDQISMSTIKLQLIAPTAVIVAPGPPSPWSAFVSGLAGFGLFFTWLFLVVLYALPWLALAAVIWAAVIGLLRWRRKRRAVTPAE
jgi:Domain of unknown function (DUF4349)